MRTLASIQTITSLTPIKNADAIECAHVLGWDVVVKKGEYQPGDRVVYVEIDSLLPERTEFEFLRKACFKPAILDRDGKQVLPAGFRVRTVKLRGQVSQGICFPLSILPDATRMAVATDSGPYDGADVTEDLGIVKWELPEDLGGYSLPGASGAPRSTFPVDIPKTDETRVQVLGGLIAGCKGMRFVATEKLDGTSFTAVMRGGVFSVCSRNQTLDPTDVTHMHVEMARALDLENLMRRMAERIGDFALQGEMVGSRIQGNKYGLPERQLYIFDLYLIDVKTYVAPDDARSLVEDMGLTSVPWIGEFDMDHKTADLVSMAEGPSVLLGKIPREGLVLRPKRVHRDERGNRISFKAINPQFLLKFDA